MALSEDVRRVVTTLDDTGKAVVLFDGDTSHTTLLPNHRTISRLLWTTDRSPAEFSGSADRGKITLGIAPLAGGSIFRIIDFPPTGPEVEQLDPNYLQSQLAHTPIRGRPPRHPLMHRTRTVDYAIIMQGEIDMLLDDAEIHLKAGDVLIQQGTNHAWINRGTEPCRVAFVLIDAVEP